MSICVSIVYVYNFYSFQMSKQREDDYGQLLNPKRNQCSMDATAGPSVPTARTATDNISKPIDEELSTVGDQPI